MWSFSEVLGVTDTPMVCPLPPSSFIGFIPLADSGDGRAIKPGRTSWHGDGIVRGLEGRPDGWRICTALGLTLSEYPFYLSNTSPPYVARASLVKDGSSERAHWNRQLGTFPTFLRAGESFGSLEPHVFVVDLLA
jgi:hypothetical protein